MSFRPVSHHTRARGIAAAALLLAVTTAAAQNTGDRELPVSPADTARDRHAVPDVDLFSIGIEYVPSPLGGDFFKEYPALGGTGRLDGYLMPSAMMRFSAIGPVRVIVYGAWAGSDFTDIYDVRVAGSGTLLASVVEEFTVSSIPVLVGLEYAPVRDQFTTYAGASVGIAYSNVEWTTTVREQTAGGFSRPATNARDGAFHPAYRIYAGIDYRFDRNLWERGPVRGIFLEGSYLGVPIRRDYFAAIRGTGRELQGVPAHDDATLDIGGVTFTVGVNLQFVRR